MIEVGKCYISMNFAGHSLKQVVRKLASMMLSSCFVKVALNCGAEDARLLAKELNIDIGEIQKLNKYEAILGIRKNTHKVQVFPGGKTAEYQPEQVAKENGLGFHRDDWIAN